MAGGKEITTKIRSIENTKKVTSALEMVSASKIRKSQDLMQSSRPYARMVRRIIGHLSKGYCQRVGLADCLIHEPEILVLDAATLPGGMVLAAAATAALCEDEAFLHRIGSPENIEAMTAFLEKRDAAFDGD